MVLNSFVSTFLVTGTAYKFSPCFTRRQRRSGRCRGWQPGIWFICCRQWFFMCRHSSSGKGKTIKREIGRPRGRPKHFLPQNPTTPNTWIGAGVLYILCCRAGLWPRRGSCCLHSSKMIPQPSRCVFYGSKTISQRRGHNRALQRRLRRCGGNRSIQRRRCRLAYPVRRARLWPRRTVSIRMAVKSCRKLYGLIGTALKLSASGAVITAPYNAGFRRRREKSTDRMQKQAAMRPPNGFILAQSATAVNGVSSLSYGNLYFAQRQHP